MRFGYYQPQGFHSNLFCQVITWNYQLFQRSGLSQTTISGIGLSDYPLLWGQSVGSLRHATLVNQISPKETVVKAKLLVKVIPCIELTRASNSNLPLIMLLKFHTFFNSMDFDEITRYKVDIIFVIQFLVFQLDLVASLSTLKVELCEKRTLTDLSTTEVVTSVETLTVAPMNVAAYRVSLKQLSIST